MPRSPFHLPTLVLRIVLLAAMVLPAVGRDGDTDHLGRTIPQLVRPRRPRARRLLNA